MSIINKIRKDGVDYNLSTNDIYSTEEQVIGRWIDGKPLYRKVIMANNYSIPNRAEQTIPHGIKNIENVIRIDTAIHANWDGCYGGSSMLGAAKFHSRLDNVNLIYRNEAGDDWTLIYISSIIEYTKTTD